MMPARTLICFPIGDAPGPRADAAQLALGLAACGHEVLAFGPLGPWRHVLRQAKITAIDFRLPGEERKFTQTVQEQEPQLIHAFGADAAHLALPLTMLVGAGGVATLSHGDLPRLQSPHFRTASAVFVCCEYLREQVARRLPGTPVMPTGYLLPTPIEMGDAQRHFLADELGIQDGAPVVLLADRFHGSEAAAASALIAAAPIIAHHVAGVQIVIAGAGMRLGELEQQAIEVNNALGYRAVLLPGQRDDIQSLLALATVAVGSGRFAMEAQGAGVALVAAGAAGMIGVVTEETARLAQFTCCGRHGHLEAVSPKTLASDIIGLFAYPQYRDLFAREGQRSVLETDDRVRRAEQIAAYYTRTSPTGAITRTPQRIVAVLPDDLRELLFTLPAISGMREHFPLVKTTLVAAPEHHHLLQRMHLAECVLAHPDDLRSWYTTQRALAKPRADACIAFAAGAPAAILSGLSGAHHRIGFHVGATALCFSDHLPVRAPFTPVRAQELVHGLGISTAGALPPPIPADDAAALADVMLRNAGVQEQDRVIVLCPRADDTLAWPTAHWNALLRQLCAERSERIVVLDAGALDLPDKVIAMPAPAESMALAALLSRAMLVIAPDAGPLHLADLLGIPTIGLYGPTSPDICRLAGDGRMPLCHRELACHPCMGAGCVERRCLYALTPAEVAAAVTECCGAVITVA